jgi:hypothetical protein
VPQGVGSAEADGGPSLQGFLPPRPPRPSTMAIRYGRLPLPSATAMAKGRESSDLIATSRWNADGIRRGHTQVVGRPP